MQALHKSTRFLRKRKKGNTRNQNSRNRYPNNSEKDKQTKKQTNWKLIIKEKDHIMGKLKVTNVASLKKRICM